MFTTENPADKTPIGFTSPYPQGEFNNEIPKSEVNSPVYPTVDDHYGSCVFMNMCGDIVLAWDKQNHDKMIAVIQKKMDEGYTFFTTKRVLLTRFKRKVKITPKTLPTTEEIIISDEQFDKMVKDMDDPDIADLVAKDNVTLAKRKMRTPIDALEIIKDPKEVVKKASVAVRPIAGG